MLHGNINISFGVKALSTYHGFTLPSYASL
jgi:hypothetical protein